MTIEPLFNTTLEAITPALDALLVASAQGCCADESWRGKFCEYHRGYRDGLDDAQRWVEDNA